MRAPSWLVVPLFACVLMAAWPWMQRAHAETYEWQRMERVLQANGLELASSPEGKRIAWVRFVRDDVFVKDEVWPQFLNWFHMTTKEPVVRRELLFQEGDAYHEARIEESMRNLRGMDIFALVRIVPIKLADPATVGVLVQTRDLWSLRLETGFDISTIVDQLLVRLTERNLLGRNKALSLSFELLPVNHWLTQGYVARRVWGSTVQLSETAGIVINNASSNAEGATASLQVGEPYYNLKQRFAWVAAATYQDFMSRQLVQRKVATFSDPANGTGGPHANRAWRQRDATVAAVANWRVGTFSKQTWGAGWDYRSVTAHATAETMLVPELRDYFEKRVSPRQRREVGPTFSYDILMPEFRRFQNLATFGQTENVRVGPTAALSVRVPLRAFGSNSNSYVFASSVGCILAPGGFLLEGSVGGRTRYESGQLVDQRFTALLRGASPVLFGAFRVVSRATLTARRNDTANTFVALGASQGLRGYTSQYLHGYGASSLLANFELRSLPFLAWQAVHVGGVMFFDTGTVYNQASQLQMHYSLGLGLRVLFPQFNRMPFSFDAGAGFDPSFRIVPTIEDLQVVPLTAVEDPK